MNISVIIPYFRRKDHLQVTLLELLKQKPKLGSYEILVIDDGSCDELEELCEHPSIQLHSTAHQGAAAARNIGVKRAVGDVFLFMDCDIVLPPGSIDEHIIFHQKNNQAIALGFRSHLSKADPIKFSEHLPLDTRKKLLNRYQMKTFSELKHPWFMAYTCHLSIKGKSAKEELFDSQFISWGLEDVEWAYRFFKKGFTFKAISNSPSLHLYHDRSMTVLKYEGWKKNLIYLIQKHLDLQFLEIFKDVFDPRIQLDYFTTYDSIEGEKNDT